MPESHKILVLQLVYSGADVTSLLAKGLQYAQIANLISEALDQGLLVEEGEGLKVTQAGLEKMREGITKKERRKDGGWISPLDEFRIEKWSLDEVYLPSQKNSFFDF
jgi:hypothetical protein